MRRNFRSIPVIDIGGLYASELESRRAVAREIEAAARDVGFFYITGHAVRDAARERMLAAAERFFSLPLSEKMDVYIGKSKNHSGYVPEGEEVFSSGKIDRKEAFDVGLDYSGPPTGGMLGPNLWPGLEGFRADVSAYYAEVQALARVLFRGFALALGEAEDFFESKLSAPPSQLRLIHYPFDPEALDAQGIGAHTDYECFTILYSTEPGLEVMNGEGDWIDAPPVPGAFVINIGDMIETWSNGAFVATSHRVRKVPAERYSFPFFATCDYETPVEPLPRFVTPEKPAAYPRIISGEHLFAQTAQTFAYLKRRIAEGAVTLPQGALSLESYGQQARARSPVR
ncbi:2-oxoglutarate and iron-dependent oxygenase domain-containing protein [Phenylobacterium sp.]|uniref:isopenicillin N synthase family dioxygenase n=1 Tax=Phenylobacterium sp. TaxID=1871053 RepID=UPI0025F5F4F6|nr:2-oxoglutarate and iron-dependent oxygenase domain-containing protein [Phenylobacterium sp.]MCA3721721.1 isopenicillin N synthase family oxygenase [Phenylobacterium sp.]